MSDKKTRDPGSHPPGDGPDEATDDPWSQPALTPAEAMATIARLKREGRLPTFERFSKSVDKATSSREAGEGDSDGHARPEPSADRE